MSTAGRQATISIYIWAKCLQYRVFDDAEKDTPRRRRLSDHQRYETSQRNSQFWPTRCCGTLIDLPMVVSSFFLIFPYAVDIRGWL